MSAGDVIQFSDAVDANGGRDFQPADTGYFIGSFAPGTSGDQIIAYQGTADAGGTSITNLAAIHYDDANFDAVFSDSSSVSLLPTGLTDGVTAISFAKPDGVTEYDSGVWNVSVQPDIDALRLAINNAANWIGSDSDQVIPTGPLTFGAGVPEIDVQGNSTSIVSGDTSPSFGDDTAFGGVSVSSGTITQTFTIRNIGGADLTLSSISISGADASDFSVTPPASLVVSPAGTATFSIEFDPSAAGVRDATVSIMSDDSDEAAYTFDITGSGQNTTTGTVLAPGDIAIVGYNASGGDKFAFVVLTDIAAGTVVNFTDAGWDSTLAGGGSGFAPSATTSDGAISWTAPSEIPAGTVIQFDANEPNGGTDFQPTDTGYFSGDFNLGSSGDTLTAYQGTAASPTNLAALHYDSETLMWPLMTVAIHLKSPLV